MKSIVSTIIVLGVLLLVIYGIVRTMIKDKKAGKPSCGGNCGTCGGACGATHTCEK
ncbi:MAG: FeoB-associated Cys-rich membrane protein [Lachnospiraceae bacterium]|nr:FeoB-associated Cys-rich membrane protein [Lachnospiraceae bacterium]